jgi:hypothetical protein
MPVITEDTLKFWIAVLEACQNVEYDVDDALKEVVNEMKVCLESES